MQPGAEQVAGHHHKVPKIFELADWSGVNIYVKDL